MQPLRRNLKIISFCGSHAPFLRYSVFYITNHLINFGSCDVVMSISTVDRVFFWIYLLNRTSFGNETWSTSKCSYEQMFQGKSLPDLGDCVLNPGYYWFTKNICDELVVFTHSKICTETIKNSKNHLLKFNKSQNIAILSKL